MHQTKKGNRWHFGMKAHIGVDVASGLVHTVVGTAANEADITQTAKLLHGLQHLKQVAGVLSDEDPARGTAKAMIITQVERLRWRIWNGKAKDAQISID